MAKKDSYSFGVFTEKIKKINQIVSVRKKLRTQKTFSNEKNTFIFNNLYSIFIIWSK